MEKYEDISQNTMSRVKKNEGIYNSADMSELSRIKTNTNVSVISDVSGKEIDLEKIKNYIYSINREEDKKKRVSLELPVEEVEVVVRKEVRDYDINSVLERARDNRNVDYESNRHRKFDNTECDILKNLKIKEETPEIDDDITGPIDELNTEEKTIVDLIKTMAHKPIKDDLFKDLMPDENDTVVMGQLEEIVIEQTNDSLEEIKEELINMTQDLESIKEPLNDLTRELFFEKEKLKQEEQEEKSDSDIPAIHQIDKSFYTNSLSFNKTDFEGFEEFERAEKKNSILTKLAIIVLVVLLLITIFLIVNSVFDLNII